MTLQSLKTKLMLLGAVGILGAAFLAGASVWHSYRTKVVLLGFVDQTIAINRSATASYAHGLQMGQALRNVLLDPANKKGHENLAEASKKFDQEVGKMSALLAQTAEGKETATKLKASIDQWLPLQKEVVVS